MTAKPHINVVNLFTQKTIHHEVLESDAVLLHLLQTTQVSVNKRCPVGVWTGHWVSS